MHSHTKSQLFSRITKENEINMKIQSAPRLGILLAGLAFTLSAAQIDGILMDKICSMKAEKGGQAAAAMHDTKCALMPDCEKSGYGVFTADYKFVMFDAEGNAKASAALKATAKKDNLKATVTGEVEVDAVKVKTLKLP